MSEITVSIAGRNYTVACADGEETHVAGLGAILNEKLQQLAGSPSPQETQNLLFAGLFVADELHEVKQELAAAIEATRAAEDVAASQGEDARAALGQRDALTARISELEDQLVALQASQQQHEIQTDELRREASRHQQKAIEASEAETAMADRVAELSKEIEAMATQLAGLEEERNGLAARVERLGSMAALVTGNGGAPTDDLARALERFAVLIEQCAEKLEGKAANA